MGMDSWSEPRNGADGCSSAGDGWCAAAVRGCSATTGGGEHPSPGKRDRGRQTGASAQQPADAGAERTGLSPTASTAGPYFVGSRTAGGTRRPCRTWRSCESTSSCKCTAKCRAGQPGSCPTGCSRAGASTCSSSSGRGRGRGGRWLG